MKNKKIVYAFLLITIGLVFHFIPHLDQRIFLFFNGLNNIYWDKVMIFFTYLGEGYALILFALPILFKRGKKNFFTAIIILVITGIVVQIVKYFCPSLRPASIFGAENIHILGKKLFHNSFPSGHAASSFALALYLGEVFRPYRFIFIAIGVLVGYSRIYVGAHFPGDIVFSWGLAFLVVWAVLYFQKGDRLLFSRSGKKIKK